MEYDKMEGKQLQETGNTNFVDRVLMNGVNDSKLLGWPKKD